MSLESLTIACQKSGIDKPEDKARELDREGLRQEDVDKAETYGVTFMALVGLLSEYPGSLPLIKKLLGAVQAPNQSPQAPTAPNVHRTGGVSSEP